ncbi:MAG: PKD domain-containing protein [Nanoarchaeota archaeon]
MRRLIKILSFGLFFILLLVFNVSAQACTDNERILRLSSTSNAHGEIYNGLGNYGTQICFPNLFPGYSIGANPHDCIIPNEGAEPTNLVLRLSDDTNAHAQAPDYTGTAYPIDICYGSLICVSSTSACPSGQTEVVSLFSDTNSNLETVGTNNYDTRICCTASTNPNILNAKWKYYDGSEIPNNDPPINVCRNNYIIASAQTVGLNGQQITFRFLDDDLGSDDEIIRLNANVVNNRAEIALNLGDSAVQTIIQGELGGTEGDDLELLFEAIAPSDTERSYQVTYQNNSALCSFEPPQANIEAPVHRGVYFANTEIPFTSGCTSRIGPVTNEWTITPQNGQPFTRTESTFNHTFTSPGQVNVKLKCTDLDGRFDVNESQMLVVASPYVLAYINEPRLNEITYRVPPVSGPYFPNEFSFNASDSFAVDSSGCTLVCIGGNCPIETENSLLSCGASGGPIPITPQAGGYSSLFFNWTFLDSDWTSEWSSFETGNGIYSGSVQYDDMSNTLNDKRIIVNVRYTNGASAQFEREFTLGRCLNNGNTYYASQTESYSTNEANDKCKGGDGSAGTADDCCATGLQCLHGTTANPLYSCQIPSGGMVTECEDFRNQSECNGNTNPAIPQASYGGNPPACTTLRCQWSSTSNSCGLNVTTYQSSSTTGACSSGPGAIITSSCSYTTSTSECVNGRKTISYSTTGGVACQRNPVIVPCGSLSFELGFFTLREFLLSILLIGAIYFVFNIRKEIKNNEK